LIEVPKKLWPPTYHEFHAFGIGLMDGISLKGTRYDEALNIASQEFKDVKCEPHYYRTGYFLTQKGKWIIATFAGVQIV
jgi:hypothetical protein